MSYYIRKTVEEKSYQTNDLTIDRNLSESILKTLSLIFFICFLKADDEEIGLQIIVESQIAGLLFILGTMAELKGLQYGPGGVI